MCKKVYNPKMYNLCKITVDKSPLLCYNTDTKLREITSRVKTLWKMFLDTYGN